MPRIDIPQSIFAGNYKVFLGDVRVKHYQDTILATIFDPMGQGRLYRVTGFEISEVNLTPTENIYPASYDIVSGPDEQFLGAIIFDLDRQTPTAPIGIHRFDTGSTYSDGGKRFGNVCYWSVLIGWVLLGITMGLIAAFTSFVSASDMPILFLVLFLGWGFLAGVVAPICFNNRRKRMRKEHKAIIEKMLPYLTERMNYLRGGTRSKSAPYA